MQIPTYPVTALRHHIRHQGAELAPLPSSATALTSYSQATRFVSCAGRSHSKLAIPRAMPLSACPPCGCPGCLFCRQRAGQPQDGLDRRRRLRSDRLGSWLALHRLNSNTFVESLIISFFRLSGWRGITDLDSHSDQLQSLSYSDPVLRHQRRHQGAGSAFFASSSTKADSRASGVLSGAFGASSIRIFSCICCCCA
jgi:hypothetical protein